MAAYNGTRRKLTDSLVLYTNELSKKSFAGEPSTNLIETADVDSDFDMLGGYDFFRIYKDKDPNQQGMFKSLAPGNITDNDVVYKVSYSDSIFANPVLGQGWSNIPLNIGSEYTLSVDVFISESHVHTGIDKTGVVRVSANNYPSIWGLYDYSKKGTWQSIQLLIKPTLLKETPMSSGNTGIGYTGSTGTIQSYINYRVKMHPKGKYPVQSGNDAKAGKHGYILFKNLQLEKNKKAYSGSTHKTNFIAGRPAQSASSVAHSSRSSASGLKDLSNNNNSFNLGSVAFGDDNTPVYSNKGAFGAFVDLGLKQGETGASSSLSLGSTTKKTYDFWINLTSVDNEYSTLFYSDVTENSKFVSDADVSKKQHIYIFNNRVFCDFYNANSLSTSAFTKEAVILNNTIHNVSVVIDSSSATNKIRIYVDSKEKTIERLSDLKPPSNLIVKSFQATTTSSKAFKSGSTVNYKIASFNETGESRSTSLKKVLIRNVNSAVSLNWSNAVDATSFKIYRSTNALGRFDGVSLLTEMSNPFFGGKSSDTISFIDDNSSILSSGAPKDANDYEKYSLKNTNFYDGTDLKATIGSYPINNYTSGKNYAEGKIYKVSVYKKALNKNQILHNYLQGAEDFDTTNNAAINVSTSASSSSGGY